MFQKELLPSNSGALSIAFTVTDKAVNFGGCAGNIVYNGKLLKKNFILLGITGKDFQEYEAWLQKHNIDVARVIHVRNAYTAQATVVTDKKGQQLTFFHEGAAAHSQKYARVIRKNILREAGNLLFVHIAANNRDFMLASALACKKANVPYFFDPGQAMNGFQKGELLDLIKGSCGVFLNEYEQHLLQKFTNTSFIDLQDLCKLFIITMGEKGSKIFFQKKEIFVPAVVSQNQLDPTGCGDAYRAGFLSFIEAHFPHLTPKILKKAGSLGAKLATACLECIGTQNHRAPLCKIFNVA